MMGVRTARVVLVPMARFVHGVAVPADELGGPVDFCAPLKDIARRIRTQCDDCPGRDVVVWAVELNGHPYELTTACAKLCGES